MTWRRSPPIAPAGVQLQPFRHRYPPYFTTPNPPLPAVEGTGGSPPSGSHVTVHYTGRLLDGSVFDSSVKRGRPFQVRGDCGVGVGEEEGQRG